MSTAAATMKNAPTKSAIAWNLTLILIPLVTAALLFALWHYEVARLGTRAMPSFGIVPPFQLIDQNNQPFGSAQLLGKIWIADFIYTTCPGPCPMISSRMSEMQKPLEKTDVQLVSFSVDPEKDTPEVLRSYAEKLHARDERWKFLTGDRTTIYNLSQNGFKLAATNDASGIPLHSSRLILVDRSGVIRGYYDATSPDAVTKVLADASHLHREQPE
jgi:protein SCO1/2